MIGSWLIPILSIGFLSTLSAQVGIGVQIPVVPKEKYNMVYVEVPQTPQSNRPKSSFWLGRYEVTQQEWFEVMGTNPSYHAHCPTCPVENVSLVDIYGFIQKLNSKTGKKYRLPNAVEWEFAARGGIHSQGFRFSGSNFIDAVAWYKENSQGETHPVGKKRANELGLYDLTGNVWEYVVPVPEQAWGSVDSLDVEWRGGAWNYGYALIGIDKLKNHIHYKLGFPVAGFRLALDDQN